MARYSRPAPFFIPRIKQGSLFRIREIFPEVLPSLPKNKGQTVTFSTISAKVHRYR